MTTTPTRRDIVSASAALALVMAAGPRTAFAQRYPDRPIRLIVPRAPGGVVDVVARPWADKMKASLGTIYIDNQGGGGGAIGTAAAARADADGYTLLIATTSDMVLGPAIAAKPLYDPMKDFAPVAMLASAASGIVVHPSVPATTLAEFIVYAKANAGKLSYASAGAGTMTNLAGELFKTLIGAPDIVHVPYKGGGPLIADLISGQIPMSTINIAGQLLDLHRGGQIRILAVASSARLKGAPDIPTAQEAGLPGMVAQLFNGVFVPAGTPRAIVDQIAQGSRAAMADLDFQKTLIASGLEPVLDSSPEAAQRTLADEIARWTPIVKSSGMKQD